ncbi:hypothetical protein HMPREF3190_01146 [Umbribacter vaginalis]|nr:hypothetical protein HMPREF3190_01146 [Coriobacteriales bacterium DNF00809]
MLIASEHALISRCIITNIQAFGNTFFKNFHFFVGIIFKHNLTRRKMVLLRYDTLHENL